MDICFSMCMCKREIRLDINTVYAKVTWSLMASMTRTKTPHGHSSVNTLLKEVCWSLSCRIGYHECELVVMVHETTSLLEILKTRYDISEVSGVTMPKYLLFENSCSNYNRFVTYLGVNE